MMMFPHLRSSKRAPVAEPGEAYNNNDDDNHKRISNTSTNTTNTSLSSLHSSLSERLIVPILINNDSSTSNGSNTAEDRTKRTASSQTKKKKQVSFACGGASIQIVPARRHYTKKQRAKIWYSAEELKAIAGEIRQIIQFMIGLEDEGEEAYVEYYQQQQQQIPLITTTATAATASSRAPPAASPVDEEDVVGCTPSTRGLEALTPYGARHKKIVMLDGMCAVFLEQEKQKQLNIKNADRIREAYVAYTHEAAIAARERGQSDACLNRDDDDDDDENYEDANVEEEKQQESEEEVSIFSSETISLATTVETDRSSELFLIKEAAAAYSAGNGGTTTTAGGPATGTATGPGKKRRSIVKRLLTGRHFR